MLHFRWMRGLGNVPLHAQLLSYSCWDSGCLRPGLWLVGTILGGFLVTSTQGRAVNAINTNFQPLSPHCFHCVCA